MVHPAEIEGEVAAAVDDEDAQLRMPIEHAAEDEVTDRDRLLERLADRVDHEEWPEPPPVGEAEGMDHERHVEAHEPAVERIEARVRQLELVHMRVDLEAA